MPNAPLESAPGKELQLLIFSTLEMHGGQDKRERDREITITTIIIIIFIFNPRFLFLSSFPTVRNFYPYNFVIIVRYLG